MSIAIILGAGFSKNSGLPVQTEISPLIIRKQENNFENSINSVVCQYLKDVFGWSEGKEVPELDDILISLDISINSGHFLGVDYSPLYLKAMKKAIVYKIFSILENSFVYSYDVERFIKRFYESADESTFIVLNWDCVLEKYIMSLNNNVTIDYGNNALSTLDYMNKNTKEIKIYKLHGSSNWMYCENCRVIINDMEISASLLDKSGLGKKEYELLGIDNLKSYYANYKCLQCGCKTSSHIATQGYGRSFKTDAFPSVWKKAEDALVKSDRWVFVGYSLQQADYEIKHLFKLSQLKLNHKREKDLEIEVVLLNSKSAPKRYKSFFGSSIKYIYNTGIEGYIGKMVKD